jgi:hypothetical protein
LLRASRRSARAIAIVDLVSGVIRREHPVTVWQFVRWTLPRHKPLHAGEDQDARAIPQRRIIADGAVQSRFVVNGTTLG